MHFFRALTEIGQNNLSLNSLYLYAWKTFQALKTAVLWMLIFGKITGHRRLSPY